MAIQQTMRVGAEGIKVRIGGRLNGADIARSEEFKEGRTPLHTFRADIDYAHSEAQTVYGKLGIKVWICKGEIFGKRDLSPVTENTAMSNNQGGGGGNDRRGGGDRRDDRREGGGRDDRRGGGGGDRRGGGGGTGGGGNNRGGSGGGGNNRGGGGTGGGNNRGGSGGPRK